MSTHAAVKFNFLLNVISPYGVAFLFCRTSCLWMTGVLRGRPRARVPQDDSPVMSPLVEKLTSDRHSLICRCSPCVVVMCLISRREGGQGIDAVCIMKLRRFRLQPETVQTWSLFENLSCNYFFFPCFTEISKLHECITCTCRIY